MDTSVSVSEGAAGLVGRLGLAAAGALAGLVLLAGSAGAETNCLVRVISAEKEVYGTAWGRKAVSELARNPEQFAEADSLGDVARLLARAPRDDCPVEG